MPHLKDGGAYFFQGLGEQLDVVLEEAVEAVREFSAQYLLGHEVVAPGLDDAVHLADRADRVGVDGQKAVQPFELHFRQLDVLALHIERGHARAGVLGLADDQRLEVRGGKLEAVDALPGS